MSKIYFFMNDLKFIFFWIWTLQNCEYNKFHHISWTKHIHIFCKLATECSHLKLIGVRVCTCMCMCTRCRWGQSIHSAKYCVCTTVFTYLLSIYLWYRTLLVSRTVSNIVVSNLQQLIFYNLYLLPLYYLHLKQRW